MAIGIFDSGVGGLTVFKSISEHFPNADIYYLGDTARVPYGNKSKETIKRYSSECADFLIKRFNVDLIVIACNTASSYAIDFLKKKYGVPVIGVVIPGARRAVSVSKNARIGVIGTRGTVRSCSYYDAIKNISQNVSVFQKACPLLVPLVEEARIDHNITDIVIKEYLDELNKENIDTLILGCTHYPLLKKRIKMLYSNLNIVDSSEVILGYIEKLGINFRENSIREIFVTDKSESFSSLVFQILGEVEIKEVFIEQPF